MKKLLLILMMLGATVSVSAQTAEGSTSDENTPNNVEMREVVDILKKVQAFVFLYKDEDRTLETCFKRADQITFGHDWNSLQWEIANNDIATINADGVLHGRNFGETFITVTEPDGTKSYFAVFVSPTITVLSPEGAIYKYQKMYRQPARVQFTASKDYVINCVMVKGLADNGGWLDITDAVAKDPELGDDERNDGWFESNHLVTSDLVFVVSEENAWDYDNDGEVVGSSHINLQVRGNQIALVNSATKQAAYPNTDITIHNLAGEVVGYYKTDFDGTVNIDKEGVYLVKIDGVDGNFKVIIKNI